MERRIPHSLRRYRRVAGLSQKKVTAALGLNKITSISGWQQGKCITTMTVLGISANSRILGIATIQGNQLLDFNVRLFKERWSSNKAQKIVSRLLPCIQQYSIKSIALAMPPAHYRNKETEILLRLINTFSRKQKVRITTYNPKAFSCFCLENKARKKALMDGLSNLYPELGFIQRKELRNKRRHYHKLFEAVAAGTLLAQELKVK
jgi:DNA polymerase elongation subunit (family B)